MKRLFFAIAIAAVASFVVAATASAKVERHQEQSTTTNTTTTTTRTGEATFTVTSPMAPGDWQNVWTQKYTVTVNPLDNTFEGTGVVSNNVNSTVVTEKVTGSFAAKTVTFTAVRPDGFEWSLINAPTDGTTVTDATVPNTVPWLVEMTVSSPEFATSTSTSTTTTTTTSDFKNHGQYVSSQGGGDDAAHSLTGMPLNSSK